MQSNPSPRGDIHAWVLGSGVPSLAAAMFLIEEAKIPPDRVHILEAVSTAGGSTVNTGDPVNGYEYRTGALSTFNDVYVEKLLSMVPSQNEPGKTALDDILEFNEAQPVTKTPHTRFLVEKSNGISTIGPKHVGLGLRDRIDMFRFLAKTEKSLGRSRIREYFHESFFRSNYWLMFATTIGFQPWHGTAEFHRAISRFMHDVEDLSDPRPLDRGPFNRHEAITTPIARFLVSRGVDFRFHSTISDIIMDTVDECHRVTAIKCETTGKRATKTTIDLAPNDIVIVSLGSSMSSSTAGTNTTPPELDIMEHNKDQDENWLLWLELCTKNPKFGNPYNFYTRKSESCLEVFTVTLRSPRFFEHFASLTGDKPGDSAIVTLKDSSWLLNISIPQQPLFRDQPPDVHVFWGYAMHPANEGDFIKKPMMNCSGREIMAEILCHLRFPIQEHEEEEIIRDSITIPCLFPRMTATLLPRAASDRPQIIPEKMTNLALIGHFVEIPDEVVGMAGYGVKAAQMAVQKLMGLGGSSMTNHSKHSKHTNHGKNRKE